MATVNLDLFVNTPHSRLVSSLTNPAPPTLPSAVAGDTWALRIFFLDDGTDELFRVHRYAGSVVTARFRAAGNGHIYASGNNTTEIVPSSTAVTISTTQAGDSHSNTPEIQRVLFATVPSSGSFTLSFLGPAHSADTDFVVGPKGTTAPISVHASAADIQDAIRALEFHIGGGNPPGGIASGSWSQYLTVSGTAADFSINYANGSPRPGDLPPCTINTTNVVYTYGWNVSVPLTDSDFADLFLAANGPSFFEILLDGATAVAVQLTADPAGSGANAPAFTNGPPPSASFGVPYSFAYTARGFPAPTFAVTSGILPPGLTLDSVTGLISGTPIAPGTYSLVVTASNGVSPAATQAFAITVGGNPPGSGAGAPLHDLPATYFDGDFPTQLGVGDYFISHPLESVPSCLLVGQLQECRRINYAPPALNAAGPVINGQSTYFVRDSETTDVGGEVCQWTRFWATIPAPWSEPGGNVSHNYAIPHTVTYQAFDGYVGSPPVATYKTVTYTTYENVVRVVRARHEYLYSLDLNMAGPGPGGGEILHEPSIVTRWMGGIYQARSIIIPA